MLDDRAWDEVADRLEPGDFYRPAHRIIFEVMRELAGGLQPLDMLTVSEAIRARGLLEKTGGVAYLAELAESTPAASNVLAYARIVGERSTLRQQLGAVNDIGEAVFAPAGRTSAELLDEAERAVFAIAESHMRDGGPQRLGPLLAAASERLEQLAQSGGGLTGLATGFADLDERTAGLQASELVVIAGRPSMGKTALAVNMAEHAVMADAADEHPVVVFSLEQPAEQLTLRLLSSLGAIEYGHLRSGRLEDAEWARLALRHPPALRETALHRRRAGADPKRCARESASGGARDGRRPVDRR